MLLSQMHPGNIYPQVNQLEHNELRNPISSISARISKITRRILIDFGMLIC